MYLRLHNGYGCDLCPEDFLTTSLELMQKHAAKYHKDHVSSNPWRTCKMATLFQETKNRHYRRVDGLTQSAQLLIAEDQCMYHGNASLQYNMTDCHPVALTAARHVSCIPLLNMDLMFKSTSFRTISRPLFTPGSIDAENAMFYVFPGSELDPLFFQALVYAMIRVSSDHTVSRTRYLYLESVVVRQLNERIEAFEETRQIAIPTIGVLLLLKLASYKIRDLLQHDIHTKGVQAALNVSDRAILPEALQRAIFWQDLYAAVLVGSPRLFRHFMTYESFDSLPTEPVPVGFARLESRVGRDLIDCIVNTIRFDKERKESLGQRWSIRYRRLDGLQASIESQLQDMTSACRERGAIAEVVRLATLFWCYCSWMEVWNDPLVPCRILRLMLDVLEQSLVTKHAESVWRSHLDLLCWLLCLASDVISIEIWQTRQIAPQYHGLFQLANGLFAKISVDELRTAECQAETDFVPSPPWRRQQWGELPLFA